MSFSCLSGVVLCINDTLPYSLHENTKPWFVWYASLTVLCCPAMLAFYLSLVSNLLAHLWTIKRRYRLFLLAATVCFILVSFMPLHPLLLLPRQSRHQIQLLRLGIAGTLTQDRSCWIQPVKKKISETNHFYKKKCLLWSYFTLRPTKQAFQTSSQLRRHAGGKNLRCFLLPVAFMSSYVGVVPQAVPVAMSQVLQGHYLLRARLKLSWAETIIKRPWKRKVRRLHCLEEYYTI